MLRTAVSRILTEYRDSGLFLQQHSTSLRFEEALEALTITNPSRLELLATDLIFGETFDTPGVAAVVARGRGRGRGGTAAVPPVAGPPALRFLSMVTLFQLYRPDQPVPFANWAHLAGVLGPMWTRAVRAQEASQLRAMASVMVPNLNK